MKTQSEELHEQLNSQSQKGKQLVISYAIHMHPMTQLKTPDLLDQAKNSLFEITCQILYAALPLILCFETNIMPGIINLYLIGNYEGSEMMSAIGLGTVMANIFGFLIIENMSLGFSVICSYFKDNSQQIGFMYQKTLGINFFICILITPILYLSDKFLILLGFNSHIVGFSTEYIWALVPSFYLYSFYETTKNYLMSQNVIYPSLIISTIGCIIHFFVAKFFIVDLQFRVTGAAWATNVSLGICCLLLYIYILKEQPTKQSWIQWNICATNNLHKFLWQILTHEIFAYFQALAFQILSIIACRLANPNHISAHFALSNCFTMFYFMILGISHCLNRTVSLSIEENDIRVAKRKFLLGIFFILGLAVIIVANLISQQDNFFILFHNDVDTVEEMKQTFGIFILALLLNSLQMTFFGILKVLQLKQIDRISGVSFYIIGLGFAVILAFYFDLSLKGIWIGWLCGIIFALLYELRVLNSLQWEEAFDFVRDKYKVLQQQIRYSRMEIQSISAQNR